MSGPDAADRPDSKPQPGAPISLVHPRRAPQQELVLTASAVAAVLGVVSRTVRNYERSGVLPFSREDGPRRRYRVDDLLALARLGNPEITEEDLRALLNDAASRSRASRKPEGTAAFSLEDALELLRLRGRTVIIVDERGTEISLPNGERVVDAAFRDAVFESLRRATHAA